jgi:hypothetical protein
LPDSTWQSSSDHPIRSRQHIGWNREADLLGGFEIDNEFKFRRLLNWNIGRLCSFKNLIDKKGYTASTLFISGP